MIELRKAATKKPTKTKAFKFKGDPQDFAAFSCEFIKYLEEEEREWLDTAGFNAKVKTFAKRIAGLKSVQKAKESVASEAARNITKAEVKDIILAKEARLKAKADAKAVEAEEGLKVKEDEASGGLSNKEGLKDLAFHCCVKCGFSSMDKDNIFKHVHSHGLEAARSKAKI